MKKILFLCGFVGIACACYHVVSSIPRAQPQKRLVAPDDGAAPRWEKPKTTRRYLHGPLSERLLTFWREGKIVFAENEHLDDWLLPYRKQYAHAAWLVRGDGTPFDFKDAELNVTVGGEPDHSQSWTDEGVCVRLSACAPFGRKPSVFARASFSNEGTAPAAREFLVLLRSAPEMMLVHSGPDVYSFYEADVGKWLKISAADWKRGGDTFRYRDRFASFAAGAGVKLSWDADKGGVRFAVELKPGETKSVDFTLGRGEEPSIGYDAARSAMKESWKAELSRIVLPETARRDRERKKLVRHLAVQMLQCIGMPANGAGHVLPRQGGLQRLVWPGESIHVVVALDLLGLSNYADEICDFYMKHCMQDSGEAGPFRNNWAGDTAYVLRIFAQHCVDTRNTAMWRKYSAKAAKAFAWIRAKRTAGGLFPAMKSTDSTSGLQHWGHTDLVNMEALEWYAKGCEMFGEPNAAEVRAEWNDYRGVIVKILDGWREKSKGKDELFLPITATGESEDELVGQGFFYLHPAGFAESGLLTTDELLRLRTNILRRGFANDNGLYMRHPSPVPEFNRHGWYTTWSEKQWMAAWMRAGKYGLAEQALEATLKYSVSDEFIVGERYHDTNPWYFPWSPNASGSGRIVQMLFNSPEKPKKKWIVASGFDIMHARLEDYGRKAKDIAAMGIDGISVAIRGVWPDDGRESKLSDPLHGRPGEAKPISIRQADFSRARRIVSKMVKEHLPKSMLRVGLTSKNRIDWRDDEAWGVAADNLAFLAEFARDTGLVGMAFDEEDYSNGRQFFKTKDDPPPEELAALVRKRGRQVFEAIFRAYPDMMFHSSWLYSTIQKWHAWVTPEFGMDQAALAASFGELWGFFMNGAIDAMPPEATIVEGNEERGYHGNAGKNEFAVAAWRTSRGAIGQMAPEVRKKFLSQLSVSFGQYNDSYVNSAKSEYYFPPLGGSRLKRWHENLQSAVNVADDYVWIYGEKGTYVDWERDLSKAPGVETERCYYLKTWEEQLPGFSRMLKTVKGDYSVLDEEVKSGRMVRVGGLDTTWTKDGNPPENRFERNVKPGALSEKGFARQNGSGCFCSRIKVKAGEELYVKASVKGCNPRVGLSFLAEGKFDFKRFGRPRTVVPPVGWQHDQWQDLRYHVLVPEGATEVSITFGGPASPENPNCFDCVDIYKGE